MGAKPSLFVIVFLIALPQAWAWPPLFGGEFTFTNPELLATRWRSDSGNLQTEKEANRKVLDQLGAKYEELCRTRLKCKISSATNKHGDLGFRVTYEDGWWFQFTPDAAVVEVQIQPNTVASFQKLEPRIQADVFDVASALALAPNPNKGGGHIHMDLPSAFGAKGEDAVLFRNFQVDQANSDGLFRLFESRGELAAPFSKASKEAKENFSNYLNFYDRDLANPSKTAIRDLSIYINHNVYGDLGVGRFYRESENPKLRPPLTKAEVIYYQANNLTRLKQSSDGLLYGTHEFRAVPAQRSAHDFVQEIELIQTRLDFLKKKGGFVPLSRMPISPSIDSFNQYLQEMGLNPAAYANLAEAAQWHAAGMAKSKINGKAAPQAGSATKRSILHRACIQIFELFSNE